MATFTVLYDACVLYPAPLRDLLMELALTDLYYQLDNREGYFRPGQKVNANLVLREEKESLVVPWSAVVVDINGGYWVYENVGEHKYARRRVQVKYVVDSLAVLAGNSPAVGAKVVTEGAAELFGTEFFVPK